MAMWKMKFVHFSGIPYNIFLQIMQDQQIKLRECPEIQVSNNALDLKEVADSYPEFECVTHGKYYPYDHIHKDNNWGCAWRSIQLLLSSKDVQMGFQEMFQKFSRKKLLLPVLKQRLPAINTPEVQNHKWAPQQNQKNWAEPFIGQLVCEYHKFKTNLFIVNGLPHCYAPQQVFTDTIGFQAFKTIIKKVIPDSPLMIDDGTLCLSIIGYHVQEKDEFSIVFADPHIKSNRDHKNTGIYQVIYDKDGKQREVIMSKEEKESMTESYKQIYFDKKKWMVMHICE